MIPTGHRLTGRELLQFQQKASRHLGFSLTLACPLRCAHCISASVSPRNRKSVSMSREQAEDYTGQMGRLKSHGIERISFTGGEPLLARDPLALLSSAAAEADIATTVLTACHWAKDARSARDTVRSYPHIARWHLSTDRFHTAFLPLDHLLLAADAAREAGREVLIRLTVATPPTPEDLQLYNALGTHFPDRSLIAVQPVRPAGRARDLKMEIPSGNPQPVPCLTTGPAIRWNGAVSPCCGPLIEAPESHPFRFPSAHEVGLCEIYRQWGRDPLLRLIRAVGFGAVLPWVRNRMPNHPVLVDPPNHPCDICTGLWQDPETAPMLQTISRRPAVAEKIDRLFGEVFGPSPPRKMSGETEPVSAVNP